MHVLPEIPEWIPVRLGGLAAGGVGAFRCAEEEQIYRADVEERARRYELQAIRWPEPFPADTEWAMLAATYAKQIGRGVAFSLAAFRQAFAGGRDLGERDSVLIAAAACEMHPTALIKGAGLGSIARATGGGDRGGGRGRRARRPRRRDRRPRLPRRPRAREGRGGARVKANREYELSVRKAGRGPALLRGPGGRPTTSRCSRSPRARSRCSGTPSPRTTGRLARALRADLASLEAAEFLAKWRRWQTF